MSARRKTAADALPREQRERMERDLERHAADGRESRARAGILALDGERDAAEIAIGAAEIHERRAARIRATLARFAPPNRRQV